MLSPSSSLLVIIIGSVISTLAAPAPPCCPPRHSQHARNIPGAHSCLSQDLTSDIRLATVVDDNLTSSTESSSASVSTGLTESSSPTSTSSLDGITSSTTTTPLTKGISSSSFSLGDSGTSTASSAVALVTNSTTNNNSKFTLKTSIVVDLDNQPIAAPTITTDNGLEVNAAVYDVDGPSSTADQISTYHNQGKTVGCYFSAGTWEPGRPDALDFDPACYCGPGVATSSDGQCTGTGSTANLLSEWGEWYLDIHSPACIAKITPIMQARMTSFKDKGCDAVDPDNVDSYENTQNFGITADDAVNYLLNLSKFARSIGLGIDLKNGGNLLVDGSGGATSYQQSLVDAFDFNIIEECHRFNECDNYDSFLAAGKPQIQIEYSNSITTCPTLKSGQNLLVYSGTVLDSSQITLQCLV